MKLKHVAACTLLSIGISSTALAADHNDAPDIMGAEGSLVDITDVYAFRSPTNADNLVLVMGLFAPEVATTPPLFATNAKYELYVDTNGDSVADTTISTSFETNANGTQTFQMTGIPSVGTVTGDVSTGTEAVFTTKGSAKAFCGLRDDHFFFDLVGFQGFTSAPCIPTAGLRCPGKGSPEDFFAGRNTSTIIVEFPVVALKGVTSSTSGSLGVWAKTFTSTDS
jgi:Domain of unknown function (DUF4331)